MQKIQFMKTWQKTLRRYQKIQFKLVRNRVRNTNMPSVKEGKRFNSMIERLSIHETSTTLAHIICYIQKYNNRQHISIPKIHKMTCKSRNGVIVDQIDFFYT